jgi:poly-beta-1,6-N-acetyl-D-glucosamine synthase
MPKNYVMVTAAYNEADGIAQTIESVVQQTILPQRWVIVDDGSTDDTPVIVRAYAQKHRFLHYHQRQRVATQSYFASNVYALMEGVRQVADLDYEFLAVLDADITLPNDYYEQIFLRFEADPMLGVASGVYENLVNGKLRRVLNDRRSTPKALQVFRRECFARIGGYVPLRHGGEDTCSCIMARMHGWKSWSFPELKTIHRRPTGTGNAAGMLRVRFKQGLCEYGLATHPLFMIVKSLRRSALESPVLVGGLLRLCGYLYGYLKREPRQMPEEAAHYIRRDQLKRVFGWNQIDRQNRVDVRAL